MADLSLSHITMWLGILAGAGVLYVSLNNAKKLDQQTERSSGKQSLH